MFDVKKKNLLYISPHTDDVELACGATLVRCIREGANVHYLALTATDNRKILLKEVTESMKIFGISEDNFTILNFKDMYFPKQMRLIMVALEKIREWFKPDIVFCPSRHDLHQDHHATVLACLRVFKWTADIYGYNISWNLVTEGFSPNLYVEVSKKDLCIKMDAVDCYISQKNKVYVKDATLEGRARSAGVQVGVEFAEAFEIYRMVWMNG